MPTMALLMEVGVRLCGKRKSTAASDQYPVHTISGVTTPPTPRAAADDSTPTVSSSGSDVLAVGQAMRPSMAYSKTDPGAPVSALALPVNTMPMPSPTTQIPKAQANESPSAYRTVGR